MDIFLSDHITTLAVGLILSIAIFGAFKAGQVFERATISERIHEVDLEKLEESDAQNSNSYVFLGRQFTTSLSEFSRANYNKKKFN